MIPEITWVVKSKDESIHKLVECQMRPRHTEAVYAFTANSEKEHNLVFRDEQPLRNPQGDNASKN
jgi:hypothetical protein